MAGEKSQTRQTEPAVEERCWGGGAHARSRHTEKKTFHQTDGILRELKIQSVLEGYFFLLFFFFNVSSEFSSSNLGLVSLKKYRTVDWPTTVV